MTKHACVKITSLETHVPWQSMYVSESPYAEYARFRKRETPEMQHEHGKRFIQDARFRTASEMQSPSFPYGVGTLKPVPVAKPFVRRH